MNEINFEGVNSIYSMIPITLYMIYGIIRDIRKNKRSKNQQSIDAVIQKLAEHQERDLKRYAEISRDIHAQKVLISILLTPKNCSNARYAQLENEYQAARDKGVNGIVKQAFLEFCETREKMQSNLKK